MIMDPTRPRILPFLPLSFRDLSKRLIAGALILLWVGGSAWALEDPRRAEYLLLDAYRRIGPKLEQNAFGVPLHLESADRNGSLHADAYGVIDHPFSSVRNVLTAPANWCDIASLHPNVKAATYRALPGIWELTIYCGRKVLQSPEAAHRVTCRCRKVNEGPGYLDIVLEADEGPFGTKNHRMRFEALALDGGRTLTHVSYSYSYGRSLHFAEKLYFTTLGRQKVGFTVNGTDDNGKPVYIGGPRGAIERNAVRFYLAIQSFMDTLRYPEESRFGFRLSAWYDLTSRFKRQLFEMEKEDYIAFKVQEQRNQVMLQRRISASLQ
jgi:hypothetical protein